jgi:quercetin dioxygenase-like cupin family protein
MSNAIFLPSEIGVGKDREVRVLFADRSRKLVLIQLRRGALLDDHTARFPITIQTVVGKGILHIGDEAHDLVQGVIVPVDANVIHNVQADPDVAILVSFFRQAGSLDENDTTARFD